MSNTTHIQWTDATWNWLTGCSRISAGCKNCYAHRAALRYAANPKLPQYTEEISAWNGTVELVESQLDKPLRRRKPTKYFTCSMSDVFHESVPFEWIDLAFGIMALCPQHTFQVLTKRPVRMLEWSKKTQAGAWRKAVIKHAWKYVGELVGGTINLDTAVRHPGYPLPNVWLGVSVENQQSADERIPILLEVPATVRFISDEPLLGEIDLGCYLCEYWRQGLTIGNYLDWVIVGGESGIGARECHLGWIKSLIRQCCEAKTAIFVKQLGRVWAEESRTYCVDSKGGNPDGWPEEFRVRQFPSV
jgi:protein gp37